MSRERMTATDRILARMETRVRRDAESLIERNGGDYDAAADDAWTAMEMADHGRDANHWGAVCLIVQRLAEEARASGL